MRYTFMVLKEHPYGREMLAQLLEAGLVPDLVIEEDSPVADEEREKFCERLAGQRLALTFDELLDRREVRRATVPNHNQQECEAILKGERPELVVLGGTRILKPNVLRAAHCAILNAHPGLLPEVRGSASVAWSIYHDVPIGCTCHLVEEGIDTGAIVRRREISVRRGQTYEELVHATVVLAGTLMVEAVLDFAAGKLVGSPQGPGGTTYRVMPPELLVDVRRKLATGTYRYFA